MKKKFVYSICILLLLLYSVYWIRYERAFSSIKIIPRESTIIFQLNLRNIEKLVLVDFVKNPLLYIKKNDSTQHNSEKTPIFKLLELPRNLIFYSTETMGNSIFYSENLAIKNTLSFKEQLVLNKYKNQGNNLENTAIYSKNHHSFILKDSLVKIALHLTKTFPKSQTETIHFTTSNTISVASKFNFNPQADFQYWDQKTGSLLGEFLNGQIIFNSDSLPSPHSQSKKQNNAVGYIYGNLKNIPLIRQQIIAHKKEFKKLTNNSIDSINNYWNGDLQLNLYNFKTVTDSIVSYDYDENFNRLKTVKLQQRIVPNLHLNFGQNNASKLWSYFKNNNTLKKVEKDSLFTLIPLLPLKATFLNNHYFFYTDSVIKTPPPFLETKGLQFFINIAQIRKNSSLKVFKSKQLKLLNTIKGTINHKQQLNLQFNCSNKDRNGLIQLLKN